MTIVNTKELIYNIIFKTLQQKHLKIDKNLVLTSRQIEDWPPPQFVYSETSWGGTFPFKATYTFFFLDWLLLTNIRFAQHVAVLTA